jgi:predicted O-linked N-acetylglucosamine transferase (SPINDLY family)
MSLVSVEHLLRSAVLHHQAGRLAEAEPLYRRVLAARPGNTQAVHYLGLLLHQKGEQVEALGLLRRAMALSPNDSRIMLNTAQVLLSLGKAREAIELYRKALANRAENADAWHQMGLAYVHLKEFAKATECYRKAVDVKPDHARAWNCLGLRERDEGRLVEAHECYQRAIGADPRLAEAHNNLGRLMHEAGKMDEAIASYRRAIELKPGEARFVSNLAAAMKEAGELDQMLELDQRALELAPDDPNIGSNLLYDMLFHPGVKSAELFEAHVRWGDQFGERTGGGDRFVKPQAARLRVGYVSPDFRLHPIGRFILPLLRNHDRSQIESFCYGDVRKADAVTSLCRSAAHVWRDTGGLSDEELADLIRRDGIHILVDLTMHMEGNRLLVFARKPAPVQVTYLAYAGTTGLNSIEYRLTDEVLDPSGADEARYTERSVRLKSYWCYEAPVDAPEVGPLPAETDGYVTFGCLNNFAKINDGVWAAWVEILRRVAGSRLIVHAREGSHRQRVRERFSAAGVDEGRLEFVAALPVKEYLDQYNRIDVGLDPFWYPGGTTTCDALWMGAPVVTVAGETAISRGGLSIYANLGGRNWVAQNVEEYVNLAVELAADIEGLARERQGLRARMRGSRLMDGVAFARDVERAYRTMRS